MNHTCRQIAILTRHPKDVDTALWDIPRLENNLVNELVSWTRGRSSATTTHVRTHDRLIFRCLRRFKALPAPNPLVHNSITPIKES